jgi:hypothetical protein
MLGMSWQDIFLILTRGNPGALNVCIALYERSKAALLLLDTHGIYGPDIWILYKDKCGEDIDRLIATLSEMPIQ